MTHETAAHIVFARANGVVPSYMIGYAGVVVCRPRLFRPEKLPDQVSRPAFATGGRLPHPKPYGKDAG